MALPFTSAFAPVAAPMSQVGATFPEFSEPPAYKDIAGPPIGSLAGPSGFNAYSSYGGYCFLLLLETIPCWLASNPMRSRGRGPHCHLFPASHVAEVPGQQHQLQIQPPQQAPSPVPLQPTVVVIERTQVPRIRSPNGVVVYCPQCKNTVTTSTGAFGAFCPMLWIV